MLKFKLVVVGSGAVGKTCLLTTYAGEQLIKHPMDEYIPTIFDNFYKQLLYDRRYYKLDLWDTAGLEKFAHVRHLAYSYPDAFLLCYSVIKPDSFKEIESKWFPEIKHHAPYAKVILVGTKTDLRRDHKVVQFLSARGMSPISSKEGRQMAGRIKAHAFHECSALTGIGVNEIFENAIRVIETAPKPLTPIDIKPKSRRTPNLFASVCSFFVKPPTPFEILPITVQQQIISYLTDPKDRVRFAATSSQMQILEFIDDYNNSHAIKLTDEQIGHLHSWRVRHALYHRRIIESLPVEKLLTIAVCKSECPQATSTMRQKEAVANGAMWYEVENREITQKHIDALCSLENQRLINNDLMTVEELLDKVTADNAHRCEPLR